MSEVKYIHFVLPDELLARKPTAKFGRDMKGKNTFTVNAEVKAWMKTFVRDHWILRENREPKEYWSVNAGFGGGYLQVMMPKALLIVFRNPKEAMLFKLTWL